MLVAAERSTPREPFRPESLVPAEDGAADARSSNDAAERLDSYTTHGADRRRCGRAREVRVRRTWLHPRGPGAKAIPSGPRRTMATTPARLDSRFYQEGLGVGMIVMLLAAWPALPAWCGVKT